MHADDIYHFKPILIIGKAVRVSDFQCIPTDKWQRTLENPTSLSFNRLTRIDEIPADCFPKHYFHFTSYNQLPTKVWDRRDKGIKDYPILTGTSGHIVLLSCTILIKNIKSNHKCTQLLQIILDVTLHQVKLGISVILQQISQESEKLKSKI